MSKYYELREIPASAPKREGRETECLVCGAKSFDADEPIHPDGYCRQCEVEAYPVAPKAEGATAGRVMTKAEEALIDHCRETLRSFGTTMEPQLRVLTKAVIAERPSAPKREGREADPDRDLIMARSVIADLTEKLKVAQRHLDLYEASDRLVMSSKAKAEGATAGHERAYLIAAKAIELTCGKITIEEFEALQSGATAGRVMTEAEDRLIVAALADASRNAIAGSDLWHATIAVRNERAVLPLEEGPSPKE